MVHQSESSGFLPKINKDLLFGRNLVMYDAKLERDGCFIELSTGNVWYPTTFKFYRYACNYGKIEGLVTVVITLVTRSASTTSLKTAGSPRNRLVVTLSTWERLSLLRRMVGE